MGVSSRPYKRRITQLNVEEVEEEEEVKGGDSERLLDSSSHGQALSRILKDISNSVLRIEDTEKEVINREKIN